MITITSSLSIHVQKQLICSSKHRFWNAYWNYVWNWDIMIGSIHFGTWHACAFCPARSSLRNVKFIRYILSKLTVSVYYRVTKSEDDTLAAFYYYLNFPKHTNQKLNSYCLIASIKYCLISDNLMKLSLSSSHCPLAILILSLLLVSWLGAFCSWPMLVTGS